MSEREEKFERMLKAVQDEYGNITAKMEKLKAEGKTKTVSYRELMGSKLMYQQIIIMYRTYGLID